MTIFSLGCFASKRSNMFWATTLACAAPGRAALCAPVSAISPTANMWLYWGSNSCSVGLTQMNPFLGLVNAGLPNFCKPETSSLLGFWPTAGIMRSASILVPSMSWMDCMPCSNSGWSRVRLTREFRMSLCCVVNHDSFKIEDEGSNLLNFKLVKSLCYYLVHFLMVHWH